MLGKGKAYAVAWRGLLFSFAHHPLVFTNSKLSAASSLLIFYFRSAEMGFTSTQVVSCIFLPFLPFYLLPFWNFCVNIEAFIYGEMGYLYHSWEDLVSKTSVCEDVALEVACLFMIVLGSWGQRHGGFRNIFSITGLP